MSIKSVDLAAAMLEVTSGGGLTGGGGLNYVARRVGVDPAQATAIISWFVDATAHQLLNYDGYRYFDPYRFAYLAGYPISNFEDGDDVDAKTRAYVDRYLGGWTLQEIADGFGESVATVRGIVQQHVNLKTSRQRPPEFDWARSRNEAAAAARGELTTLGAGPGRRSAADVSDLLDVPEGDDSAE